jgi:hypothetical protein
MASGCVVWPVQKNSLPNEVAAAVGLSVGVVPLPSAVVQVAALHGSAGTRPGDSLAATADEVAGAGRVGNVSGEGACTSVVGAGQGRAASTWVARTWWYDGAVAAFEVALALGKLSQAREGARALVVVARLHVPTGAWRGCAVASRCCYKSAS